MKCNQCSLIGQLFDKVVTQIATQTVSSLMYSSVECTRLRVKQLRNWIGRVSSDHGCAAKWSGSQNTSAGYRLSGLRVRFPLAQGLAFVVDIPDSDRIRRILQGIVSPPFCI